MAHEAFAFDEAAHHAFEIGPLDNVRAGDRDSDSPSADNGRARRAIAEKSHAKRGSLVDVPHAEMALHLRDRLPVPRIDYARANDAHCVSRPMRVEAARDFRRWVLFLVPVEHLADDRGQLRTGCDIDHDQPYRWPVGGDTEDGSSGPGQIESPKQEPIEAVPASANRFDRSPRKSSRGRGRLYSVKTAGAVGPGLEDSNLESGSLPVAPTR
jgi:hypothetical protein